MSPPLKLHPGDDLDAKLYACWSHGLGIGQSRRALAASGETIDAASIQRAFARFCDQLCEALTRNAA